jgi:F-type H+-transporting ATPase subunit delta
LIEEQVARVWARALFEAAEGGGVVEPVRRELAEFVASLAASKSLRTVLADPQVDASAKHRVVAEITRGGQPLVANTLQLLLERGRFTIVVGLQEAFDALAAAEVDLVKVEVTSAVELTQQVHNAIAARVEEVTGRRVELAQRVDPAIIGGLVLRVGDVIVDSSLQSRVRQLRRQLATAELRGDVE